MATHDLSLSSAHSPHPTIRLLALMRAYPASSHLKSSGPSSLHSAFVEYLLNTSAQVSLSWRSSPWCPALVSCCCVTNYTKTQWLKKNHHFLLQLMHLWVCCVVWYQLGSHMCLLGVGVEGSAFNWNWLGHSSRVRSPWVCLLLLAPAG